MNLKNSYFYYILNLVTKTVFTLIQLQKNIQRDSSKLSWRENNRTSSRSFGARPCSVFPHSRTRWHTNKLTSRGESNFFLDNLLFLSCLCDLICIRSRVQAEVVAYRCLYFHMRSYGNWPSKACKWIFIIAITLTCKLCTVESLKLQKVQPHTHRIDLTSESKSISLALIEAQRLLDTDDYKYHRVADYKVLLHSSSISKLQSIVNRWSSIEEKLRNAIHPESLQQVFAFIDILSFHCFLVIVSSQLHLSSYY